MRNVVGLDLSLTATGIAAPEPVVFKPDITGMQRLYLITNAIGKVLTKNCLVFIEGYSFGSRNSQAHALGELGGLVRYHLWEDEIPYVDIPPSVLKKFATGKGTSNKDAMVATAARLGCPADDNNAVDAWWLRQAGLYALGAPEIPRCAYRDDVAGFTIGRLIDEALA